MNRRQIEALNNSGFTHKKFYDERGGFIDNGYDRSYTTAAAWGIELFKDGKLIAVISATATGHGGNGRYYVRERARGGAKMPRRNQPSMPSAKTQREAIALFIRRLYNISEAEMAAHGARSRRANLRVVS